MDKPNLDRMWETFIRIGKLDFTPDTQFLNYPEMIRIIRSKISPMILRLVDKGIINWYSFLIHDRKSGVPTKESDYSLYFHVRVSVLTDDEPIFPDYCIMTRKIKREWVQSISGINTSLLKNNEIEEAWKIIGEQSEWVLNMLNIHKQNIDIPRQQIGQFLHFYRNMTQTPVL